VSSVTQHTIGHEYPSARVACMLVKLAPICSWACDALFASLSGLASHFLPCFRTIQIYAKDLPSN
jgi:hypothetical protein